MVVPGSELEAKVEIIIYVVQQVWIIAHITPRTSVFTCGGARRSTSGTRKSGRLGKEGTKSSEMGKEGTKSSEMGKEGTKSSGMEKEGA